MTKPLAAPVSQPICGRCGHDKDRHHKGLGMCMRQHGSGFICSCSRYRKPDAPPVIPENPNSDKHHIAAKAYRAAEVAAPLPEPLKLTEQTELQGLRNLYQMLRADHEALIDELVGKGYIDEFRE